MTAAYRLKGIGWSGACVAIVLGFYLVSLQVAAERKTLDRVNARIQSAARDIRALETEFDTRANLAQLERWNGDTLALSAPTARQFLPDEAALASYDVNQTRDPTAAGIQTAALVVPSLPSAPAPLLAAAAAAVPPAAGVSEASAQVRAAAAPAVIKVAAIDRGAPMIARLTQAARGAAAVARVRPQAVAMLDDKLLSETTLGDILNGARSEARGR